MTNQDKVHAIIDNMIVFFAVLGGLAWVVIGGWLFINITTVTYVWTTDTYVHVQPYVLLGFVLWVLATLVFAFLGVVAWWLTTTAKKRRQRHERNR